MGEDGVREKTVWKMGETRPGPSIYVHQVEEATMDISQYVH